MNYWHSILLAHLGPILGEATLLIPEGVAVSIRKYGPNTGTTFDEASAIRVSRERFEASGSHGSQPTRLHGAWEEIQSITFCYKGPNAG